MAPHPVSSEDQRDTWAAFDFDGTLTRRDTLLPFLRQVLSLRRLAQALAWESPWLAAYAARLLRNDQAKERLLQRALAGKSREELLEQGKIFAKQGVPPLLRPQMIERLKWHQRLGHRCVLVTASLTLYTKPWADSVGFSYAIGSELAFDESGNAIGTLIGGNCYGPEKKNRLRLLIPPKANLYAYGDSRGDREMLAMANQGWLINAKNGFGRDLPRMRGVF
jgi:HAD superfamily hydrolase (TIGR01490 family)